jgi:putative endonuclease
MTGRRAEALVAEKLAAKGWSVIGLNVRVGRSELDIVAIDPGPPPMLVVVEVRANRRPSFGRPEESIDRGKVRALYRGALGLRAGGGALAARVPRRLPLRIDLVSVELGPGIARGVGGPIIRHLRGLVG